jgi:hypothetical protein
MPYSLRSLDVHFTVRGEARVIGLNREFFIVLLDAVIDFCINAYPWD